MLIKHSPTVTAGAYTANDCIGTTITLSGAVRLAGLDSLLVSFTVIDMAMERPELVVYIFGTNPSNGTYTNDAELDIHDTDMDYCIGTFTVKDGDYNDAKDNTVATVNPNILCQPSSGTTLYALVKTTGTPTFAAATDVQFIFGFARD